MRYPTCQQEKKDCFAYVLGGCKILSYTHFEKKCPFYKSQEQYKADLRKHPWIVIQK